MSPTILPDPPPDDVVSLVPFHLAGKPLANSIVVAAVRPETGALAALVAARIDDLDGGPDAQELARSLAEIVGAEGAVKAVVLRYGADIGADIGADSGADRAVELAGWGGRAAGERAGERADDGGAEGSTGRAGAGLAHDGGAEDRALARVVESLLVPIEGCWDIGSDQLHPIGQANTPFNRPKPGLSSLPEHRAWIRLAPSPARRSARRAQIRCWDRRLQAPPGTEARWRLEGLAAWRHWCAVLSGRQCVPATGGSGPLFPDVGRTVSDAGQAGGMGQTIWTDQASWPEVPPPALGRIGALLDDPVGRDGAILTQVVGTAQLPEHFVSDPDSPTGLAVVGAVLDRHASARLDPTISPGADRLLRLVAGHQAKDGRGAALTMLAWRAWRTGDTAVASLLLERAARCDNTPTWAGLLADLVSRQAGPQGRLQPSRARCRS